jgi:hypothetical protein
MKNRAFVFPECFVVLSFPRPREQGTFGWHLAASAIVDCFARTAVYGSGKRAQDDLDAGIQLLILF